MHRLHKYWKLFFAASIYCGLLGVPQCGFAEDQPASADDPNVQTGEGFLPTGLTIAKRVDEVNLVFTVTDSHGKFVSRLPSTDFEFLDNQQNPQSIGYFQQQSNLPLRVGLLIDLSDSVRAVSSSSKKRHRCF
jgi:hypothetical protein